MNLVIKNCNCINQADISIEPNCLNIKYAMNGTGKSTISKAILLKSQDEDALKEKLRPYGKDEESDEQPEVSDIPYTKVKVFNDSYVSTKVLAKENSNASLICKPFKTELPIRTNVQYLWMLLLTQQIHYYIIFIITF